MHTHALTHTLTVDIYTIEKRYTILLLHFRLRNLETALLELTL